MDKFFSSWWRHSTRYREDVTPGIPNNTAAKSNVDAQSADYAGHVVKPYGQRSLLVPAWYRGVTLIMQTMGQMVVPTVNSYLGMLVHYNTYELRKRVLLRLGHPIYKFIYIKGRYESIAIKKRYRKDYEIIQRIKEEDKRKAAA